MERHLKPSVHSLMNDRRGAVSILTALSLVLVFAIAALVVDTGAFYLERRKAQAATDAAAFSAAQQIEDAQAAAESVLSLNGYTTADTLVETGLYTPDESLFNPENPREDLRFTPNESAPNAVRVTQTIYPNTYFGRIFRAPSTRETRVVATATRNPITAFSVGTHLVDINTGEALADNLLGDLLGTEINLSAIDYNALLDTDISALSFLDALATRVDATNLTYEEFGAMDVSIGNVLSALIDVAEEGSGTSGDSAGARMALTQLNAQISSDTEATLDDILHMSLWAGRNVGSIPHDPGNDVMLNLFDFAGSFSRAASSDNLIDIGTAITLPVTNTSVSTQILIGEKMTTAIGGIGTTARTSQIRLKFDITIVSIPGIATVHLPVYVEAAQGEATVSALSCSDENMVSFDATTGVTAAYIGNMTNWQTVSFGTTPPAATIVSILGIPITASAAVSIPGNSGTLTFSQNDIDTQTPQSLEGSISIIPELAGTLQLNLLPGFDPLGLLTGTVNNLVSATLRPVLVNVLNALPLTPDTEQGAILSSILGLQLGTMDVIAHDVKCRAPVIVG